MDIKLVNCKLCFCSPEASEYKTDSGGYTSPSASIECDCGNSITKLSKDFNAVGGGKKTGWELCRSKWDQAMLSATSDWNTLNT